MHITATVTNACNAHSARVASSGQAQTVVIPPQPSGPGSSINGGELLFLALATCCGNDVYREAATRGIMVRQAISLSP